MLKSFHNEVKGFTLELYLVFSLSTEQRESFNFLCLLTESHLSQLLSVAFVSAFN